MIVKDLFVEIMHSKKNVIIILIDALRYDKLLSGGYKYNLTPNLNKIIKHSTSLNNHYANGCPTSVSFPSIFTSTYPLDFQGYDQGIKDRPKTFAEVFASNGYDTFGVTSAHPSGNHFYYNRGFRIYENLLDFYQWFRQNLKVFLREDLNRFKQNEISKKEMLNILSKNYLEVLNSTLIYINQFIELNLTGKNFDIHSNKNNILEEIKILKDDPNMILDKILEFDYSYYLFFGKKKISNLEKFYTRLKENLRTKINNVINIFPRRKIYAANEIFDRFKNYYSQNVNKNFLAFIHLFDVHESKNFTFKISLSYIFDFIKLMTMRKFKFGGVIYDLSVMQVDREIGVFFEYLKKKKILENSQVVITSDHGLKAGFPIRKETKIRTDLSQKFYDEFLKVPLIIFPSNAQSVDINQLTSHIDFAPTILNLCQIENDDEFLGKSIFDKDYNSDYIVAENTGSGTCDVSKKNIYLCLRNNKLKITYEIINFHIKERDVFDIQNDPNEFNNIVKSNLFVSERENFLIQAEKRLKKILDYV